MTRARHWAILLLAAGLVMALAGGLAACGGPADGALPPLESPPSPAATPESAVAPVEPPTTDTLPPTAASSSPPATIPESPPAPGGPPVPDAPAPAATATSEPAAAPVESPTGDPSAATDEAEATSLLYDSFDPTGAVDRPGRYSLLGADGVVTTYEALRDGTATTLRLHPSDADAADRGDLLALLRPGDLVEWHKAADCFVRYQVTAVPEPPAAARTIGVAWMTYAFTGCSGAITLDAPVTIRFGTLPDLGGPSLTAPIIHGVFQLIPEGWSGETRPFIRQTPPTLNRDNPRFTTDITVARTFPYWREPALPEGIVLLDAEIDPEVSVSGYESYWGPSSRQDGISVAIAGVYPAAYEIPRAAAWRPNGDDLSVHETRIIAGRPAQVSYRPPGTKNEHRSGIRIWIYDPPTGAVYIIEGGAPEYRGQNLSTVLAIARSLFESPIRVLFYDTLDSAGGVTEPGHYAFLADPDDSSSAVTTYEGLRDGTVTALRIHTHDAHGVPQADLYDAVEAGDLVEWRQAADCFVRYQVTAGPDPAAPTAYREVGVAWMTYAYAGCTGAIDPNQSATLAWGDLPNLGGPTLTTPIVHGSFQLIPENWEGALESHEIQPPPAPTIAAFDAITATWTDRARTEERAAELPYWRTPRLPEDWQFTGAGIYRAITPYGYVARWRGPLGDEVEIDGAHADSKRWRRIAATGLHVRHTLVIAGRPAYVHYRPTDLYPNYRIGLHL